MVAALCALADTPSTLRGIAHLRGHETDRLAALATELGEMGAEVTEHDDGLTIRPKPLSGKVFRTYHDHRMAHAAAVVGLRVPGVLVEDVATTAKTMPDFPGLWHQVLGTRSADGAPVQRGRRPDPSQPQGITAPDEGPSRATTTPCRGGC